MPGIGTSAYITCETVLARSRAIINDSAIAGGDVLTDTYVGSFPMLNTAYENVQKQLAACGVETFKNYYWFIGIPVISIIDPEARLLITDQGWQIVYPDPNSPNNTNGSVGSTGEALLLPVDLVCPFKLWERQSGTQNFTSEMKQPATGLIQLTQQLLLIDWEWCTYQSLDALMFRGAQQVQDVKMQYEKQLPQVAATTDPVPIRGVANAAAYELAKIFAAGRGATIADAFAKEGQEEIELLKSISVRRRQYRRNRRAPYSGRGRRPGFNFY